MSKPEQTEAFNPWQYYVLILAGVIFITSRSLRAYENWKVLDFIKFGVGIIMVIYGVYHLVGSKLIINPTQRI